MRILVTGAAGYIGSILVNGALNEGANNIIGIDLLPRPERIPQNKKLRWIRHDIAKTGWEQHALKDGPIDAVIHLSFKIRSPYGKTEWIQKENLAASKNVFEFAFKNGVPLLIYTSTVAAYGANKSNIGRLLKESDPLQENSSPYGYQKRLVEKELRALFEKTQPKTHVVVLRLGSVTGPIGQGMESKFGLVTFLKKLLPFVIEAHPAWARQFVHEQDVENAILKLLKLKPKVGSFDIYNVAPQSFLTARDMAKILKKRTLRVPQSLIRPAFWLTWHLTRGKIPTHPDSANGLIYPINVDGSKINKIGFHYEFGPADALLGKSKPEKLPL